MVNHEGGRVGTIRLVARLRASSQTHILWMPSPLVYTNVQGIIQFDALIAVVTVVVKIRHTATGSNLIHENSGTGAVQGEFLKKITFVIDMTHMGLPYFQ